MEQHDHEQLSDQEMAELEKALLRKRSGDDAGGDSNAISGGGGAKGGLLQTAMSSIIKNADYRQELKTGYFTSPMKQMQMVLALDECRECGIDETLVVDLLIAQKAGIQGGYIHDIFQALTHTTFTTNYTGKKKHWWSTPDKPQE